jgi:membrane-bound lytic murein transglycosylase B
VRFCLRIILCILVAGGIYSPAHAYNEMPFGLWLNNFRTEAMAQGINQTTLNAALNGIELDDRVVSLDRKQPDSTMSFTTYRNSTLPASRINRGKELYQQHRIALETAAKKYGVPAPYIVALWGKESSFGSYMGGFSIIRSLTTLAYEGRRAELFRAELIQALRIVQDTGMPPESLVGSWAGAMGQSQFMPSTYAKYAVDGDGDGKKDIWNSHADVFSSIANYLSKSGWKADEKWGRQVKLPSGFDNSLEDIKAFRPLSEWKKLGITALDGKPLPDRNIQAALVFAGRTTPVDGVFLIYSNYNVLLTWNYSRYFATAVGLFADKLP